MQLELHFMADSLLKEVNYNCGRILFQILLAYIIIKLLVLVLCQNLRPCGLQI